MNMIVKDKFDGEEYQVYDIRYTDSKIPIFLIYNDDKWVWLSSSYFRPLSKEELFSKS